MCGIIGIASNKSVTENINQSFKKLEYRGYDSSFSPIPKARL